MCRAHPRYETTRVVSSATIHTGGLGCGCRCLRREQPGPHRDLGSNLYKKVTEASRVAGAKLEQGHRASPWVWESIAHHVCPFRLQPATQ